MIITEICDQSLLLAKKIATEHGFNCFQKQVMYRKLRHGLNEALLITAYFKIFPESIPSRTDVNNILMGVILHDIGTAFEGNRWLANLPPLTDHVTQGIRCAQEYSLHPDTINVIKFHHEKLDGSGRPGAYTADEIPYSGRLIGIIDKFISGCEGRVYDHRKVGTQKINE